MVRKAVVAVVMVGLFAGAPARAQAPYDEGDPYADDTGLVPRITWNVGGQVAFPLGAQADRVGTGWGFAVGLTYNPAPVYGIQLEYAADWASLLSGKLANAGITGDAFMQYFDLNAVVRPLHTGRVTLYLVGGGGLYYRRATVTQITGTALAPYCDPWLYYCSVVPVATGSVIGARSSWDWGLDAGVGLAIGAITHVRFYVEARYHYIFGPSYNAPGGGTRTADGQFLPLTVGARF
jgi:opacity protein-like surface antigen